MTKKCSKCGLEKDYVEFGKDKSHSDGLRSSCKICQNSTAKKRRLENKDEIKKYRKKYYEKNKDKFLKEKKEYYEKNIDKIKCYRKNFYDKNRDKILEQKKEYYKENIDKCIDKNNRYYKENRESLLNKKKNYYQENSDKIKEYHVGYRENNKDKRREYYHKKKKDPEFIIFESHRNRIRELISRGYKDSSSKKILGCSIEFFRLHIEKQFKDGMSWDNYGDWHLDHIKPCASFDFKNPEHQKECFNYRNYQPLWAIENLSKGAKYKGVDYRGI